MFSLFFIKRPIFATVISIVVVVVGLVAMAALPIARYPDVAPPTVKISAVYPGADATTIANNVAALIEQEVNGVEGMSYMSSVSSNDGSMSLTVTFEPGTDLDTANVLVQNRVATAESRLPEEVKRQGITVKKQSTEVVMYISVYSEDGSYDDKFLSNYVWQRVRDEISRVPGVGNVQVFGAGQFSMRIWLNPDRLSSYGISASEVVSAIRAQNVQVAGGQIGAEPASKDTAYTYTVNVEGRLETTTEFEDIIVKSTKEGGTVRVRDIARVELGADTYSIASQYNGKASATMAVYQIPGTNIMDVSKGITDKLDELSKAFPKGVTYDVVYDNTNVVKASVKEVVKTLVVALLLVVFTVYIFLQNLRATFIPAITIPVSLIGTFAVLLALGYSLNQLTLFGLVLVIGIVVDDAIVVVENTTKWIEKGLSPKKAAEQAMKEVAGPVIATTLVLLAVFVPTTFMAGITGTLFKQFAVTISIATVFSSINALTLSPALCGLLLRKQKHEPRGLFKLFNWGLLKSTNFYLGVTKLGIRKAFLSLLLFGAMTGAAIKGLGKLPTGFVPQEDEGWCLVNVQLPDGASLQRTAESVNHIHGMVKDIPGVSDVLAINGFSVIDGSASSNSAFMLVVFKPWEERTKLEEQQEAIIQALNRKLYGYPNAFSFAIPVPSLPGVGTSGGFTFMLQDRGGAGLGDLQKMAGQMIQDGNAQTGISGVTTTYRASVPQLLVDVDKEQVMRANIALTSVYDTLGAFLGGAYVNDFSQFGRIFQVKAQADADYRSDAEMIKRLEVPSKEGKMVPMGSLATVREVTGPQTVNRFNLYPSIKIMGQNSPGFSSGDALGIMEGMAAEKLPTNMGYSWTDLSYQEKQAQGGTEAIFLFAILMVYLFLAAQYESWSLPLSVVLAVPPALLGAVIAVNYRGYDNNVYTQIGIVLLIALSTKSAILIVEFCKVLREEGNTIFDAAIEATRARFRAVLMTAFSFILGVIPLLVASGAGAESQKVIGTSVFGGMVVATALSLAAVPMLYFVVQRTVEGAWGKKAAAISGIGQVIDMPAEEVTEEALEADEESVSKESKELTEIDEPVTDANSEKSPESGEMSSEGDSKGDSRKDA